MFEINANDKDTYTFAEAVEIDNKQKYRRDLESAVAFYNVMYGLKITVEELEEILSWGL